MHRELTASDEWQTFQDAVDGITLSGQTFNESKFTTQEVGELERRMEILKEHIALEPLLQEKAIYFNPLIDYMLKLAPLLRKVDWLNQFVNLFLNLLMALSLSAEARATLMYLVKEVFGGSALR